MARERPTPTLHYSGLHFAWNTAFVGTINFYYERITRVFQAKCNPLYTDNIRFTSLAADPLHAY